MLHVLWRWWWCCFPLGPPSSSTFPRSMVSATFHQRSTLFMYIFINISQIIFLPVSFLLYASSGRLAGWTSATISYDVQTDATSGDKQMSCWCNPLALLQFWGTAVCQICCYGIGKHLLSSHQCSTLWCGASHGHTTSSSVCLSMASATMSTFTSLSSPDNVGVFPSNWLGKTEMAYHYLNVRSEHYYQTLISCEQQTRNSSSNTQHRKSDPQKHDIHESTLAQL